MNRVGRRDRWLAALFGLLAITLGARLAWADAVMTHEEGPGTLVSVSDVDWAVRVIPLPHEMAVRSGLRVTAGQIGVTEPGDQSPPVAAALQLLKSFALGGSDAPCGIRLSLTGEKSGSIPAALRRRLQSLPNADQAYAIRGRKAGERVEILLAANTTQGLLYAARTLKQLVSAPAAVAPDAAVVVPIGSVVDWPDIAERGEWGGNAEDDFAWMAQWKFNVVEIPCGAGCDPEGRPTISLSAQKIAEGEKLGIKVVPILPHLEGLAGGNLKGWEDCFNTPSEERAKRSDYNPAFCMSNPRTWEIIAAWLKLMVALPGVTDVNVWLSEEETRCYCERCKGREPYALEVAGIVEGFRKAQAEVNPNVRLRILTTQGSYAVNDKVLAALPESVGVTYYDGGRTYDSSHSPMIYPLLEESSRSGRWLGVYPQLTNAWRTVFPWTGPQFIQARMREFARKHLACMIGYVVPSNRFHEFNVTAAAEWSWNAAGRTPREFARAYARATGIAGPEAFADWAEKIGPVGWDIAGSRLFLRLIYDPTMGLGGGAPLDHRFEGGPEVLSEEQMERDLAAAREALTIARRLNLPEAMDETEIAIASIKMLWALYELSHVPPGTSNLVPAEVNAIAESLATLDQSATVTSSRLRRWGDRVCSRAGERMPDRLLDTIQIGPRAAAAARAILGQKLGVGTPETAHASWELGRWSADDFAKGPGPTLTFDATPYITQPGRYTVCVDFIDSAYGTDPRDLRIVVLEGDATVETFKSADAIRRVSMWDRWGDATFAIPDVKAGRRYVVQFEAHGLPADVPTDRRTCSGKVSLRWEPPASGVDDHFFGK